MFEHLDDPRPPQPGSAALRRVLARSATLRRRRSIVGGAAGLLAFAVAGASVAWLTPRPTTPAAGVTTRHQPSFTVFKAHTAALPVDTPVPPDSLADVVFTDDSHGVGLALHDAQTALVRTADGGRTWSIVDGSLPEQLPEQIEFVDQEHGFLWGGTAGPGGAVALYVTVDGGRTWTRAPIGPVVSDITAIPTTGGAANVWAIVGSCPLATAAVGRVCPATVDISADGGLTWRPTPAQPPVGVEMGAVVGPEHVEIARITTERAFVLGLPTRSAKDASSGVLAFTADGGASWRRLTDPCPAGFETGQEVAASSSYDVWFFCASQAVGLQQAKALYRSYDGGHTWALTAVANVQPLTGGRVLKAGGRLPTRGYISPITVGHENLAVLYQDAWLLVDGSSVYATTDGGATWNPVPSLQSAELVGGAAGNITFNADGHGWVSDAGAGLWETTDSLHWRAVGGSAPLPRRAFPDGARLSPVRQGQ